MGTIVASSIINKAATQLLDAGNTRWTRAELLGWLNEGQRQIVMMAPQSNNKVSVVQLAAGSRQSIPSDGWKLLDVFRYMGTDGTKPGRVVRLVSRELLDAYNPSWHAATKTATPQNFVYDEQDQLAFFVYPPNNGTGYVELNYSAVPADLASETLPISVNDIYQTALLDYVLYRANSKDAEYAPGLQLAAQYLTTFLGAFQVKGKVDAENSPNQGLAPAKVAVVPGGES